MAAHFDRGEWVGSKPGNGIGIGIGNDKQIWKLDKLQPILK
jgi:hypothetical protein